MTRDDLIAFEKEMADAFERGEIKAPLHLAGGNENELIVAFQSIRPEDWVCTQWRAHYHALLKGVPRAEVEAAIRRGRSIALCFPEHRVISSAMVGGIAPIAVGLAMGIKLRGGSEKVWCFLGDMTARAGISMEAFQYAAGHDLPVTFIIEDNGKSVCTDTEEAWGPRLWHNWPNVKRYRYELPHPHVGIGKFVRF